MDWLTTLSSLLALLILEIVLGLDNLIFLSILVDKLPLAQRKIARRIGLMLAWVLRFLMLASAFWLARWTQPFWHAGSFTLSVRDLFLMLGGFFLIAKAVQEIHDEVEPVEDELVYTAPRKVNLWRVVIHVALMDIVFSFDSVLTAIGLTSQFYVMFTAITLSILVMLYASEPVGVFITKHPTFKLLALSFLVLIGTLLVADGCGFHVPRGYLYASMGFALSVESLHTLKRTRQRKKKEKTC